MEVGLTTFEGRAELLDEQAKVLRNAANGSFEAFMNDYCIESIHAATERHVKAVAALEASLSEVLGYEVTIGLRTR